MPQPMHKAIFTGRLAETRTACGLIFGRAYAGAWQTWDAVTCPRCLRTKAARKYREAYRVRVRCAERLDV